jgi:hypothetical protein
MQMINSYLKLSANNVKISDDKYKRVIGTIEGVKHEFFANFVTPKEKQNKFEKEF